MEKTGDEKVKEEVKQWLLEKDAVRMVFEQALITLSQRSSFNKHRSCFICFNPEETAVCQWIDQTLVSDLNKMGIQTLFSLRDLSSVEDHIRFQAKIREADHVIMV